MPEGRFVIAEVDSAGEPVKPLQILGPFKTACGCLVRDHVAITYRTWRGIQGDKWAVPATIKDFPWGKLMQKFEYPRECNMDAVKH